MDYQLLVAVWPKLAGMWLISDSIFSITLYLNAPSYDGVVRQTWRRDHWVRLVRLAVGVALVLFA